MTADRVPPSSGAKPAMDAGVAIAKRVRFFIFPLEQTYREWKLGAAAARSTRRRRATKGRKEGVLNAKGKAAARHREVALAAGLNPVLEFQCCSPGPR
jgi:hypothetical protein